jgi:hypothetical protein
MAAAIDATAKRQRLCAFGACQLGQAKLHSCLDVQGDQPPSGRDRRIPLQHLAEQGDRSMMLRQPNAGRRRTDSPQRRRRRTPWRCRNRAPLASGRVAHVNDGKPLPAGAGIAEQAGKTVKHTWTCRGDGLLLVGPNVRRKGRLAACRKTSP